MTTEWSTNPIFDSYAAVFALAAVLVGVTLLGMVVTVLRGRTTWRRSAVLTALRAGVILVLLLSMLQFVKSTITQRPRPSVLLVLVDVSKSMDVPDEFGGKTRWQSLIDALDDAHDSLAALGEDVEIKIYRFGQDVVPIDFAAGEFVLPEEPTDEETAIGAALQSVLRQQQGQRIIGVILLTDGAQRAAAERNVPPEQAARRMSDERQPLYVVPFGGSRGKGQSRDVAVEPNLQVNRSVFVKNQLPIRAEVRISGYTNQDIVVELLFESKQTGEMVVVRRQTVSAAQSGERIPVEFEYVPQEVGEFRVMVRVAEQDGELVKTNNQQSTYVIVREGGLNVLYIEGEIRSEQRFLRRSLDASPDIKVDYLLIDHRLRKTDWPKDLSSLLEPGKYDAYIIGDLDSDALRREDMEKLAKLVLDGQAGLIMLGGYHSFGPGGYGATPLADVLPVRMPLAADGGSLVRQLFDDDGDRAIAHLAGPLKMRPATRRIRPHAVTRLAEDRAENAAMWSKLPPLDGANKFDGVKSGAQVLLETDQGAPLLVTQSFGGAKNVLAFAGDSTWRWCMEGYAVQHRRFWRQVVLFLVGSDEPTKGSVWIKLDKRQLRPAQRSQFTVGVRSSTGQAISDAEISVHVILPDGSQRPVTLGSQDEEVSGWFRETQQAGEYKIVATAKRDGKVYGTKSARFRVDVTNLELANRSANPSKLARLAEMTKDAGGKVVAPEQLDALVKELQSQPAEMIEQHRHSRLGDHWWDAGTMFLIVVALLGVEWFLRKKWELV